jgi:ATP-dependent exoDNAse (exonuclease V) beta subunit
VGAATGLSLETLAVLAEQAESLRETLAERGFTDLHPELPFDTELPGGPRVRGTVDLLGLSKDGREAVIIDYKSPAPEAPIEAAQPYLAQLGAYVGALSALRPETRLVCAGIHFLGSGTLAWGSPSM